MVLNSVTKLVFALLVLGVDAKNHYVVSQKQHPDHAMVQATTPTCELCFFDDSAISVNPSQNKFCLTMQGYFRIGQKWDNSHIKKDKPSRTGDNIVSLRYYTKQYLTMTPVFNLDKLVKLEQNLRMPENYFYVSTSIGYQYYSHLMCIDVWTELTEIEIFITQSVSFVDCYKYLIGYLLDFGQYAILDQDKESTKKPYGPFAKLLDVCKLENSQTWPTKTYKPLNSGPSSTSNTLETEVTKQYWVGNGDFSSKSCFPGNMLIWLIDFDRWWASLSSGKIVSPQAGYITDDYVPPKEEDRIVSNNLKSYMLNYVQPWVDVLAGDLVDQLRKQSQKPEGVEGEQELATWGEENNKPEFETK